MKYNSKYDRWVTNGGLVYRYDKKNDKLVLCKPTPSKDGYLMIRVLKHKKTYIRVHRLVFETFVSEIPQGYQIDHINTIRTDNSLENLRLCTPKENSNNPLTRKHYSESRRGKAWSEFGTKFKEHFGITYYEDSKLYSKEYLWFRKHHKCRWES